uniref:Ig-like domain-containing protein n=1 Tax=Poecilia mexicana TaxID=48701 RepID=A0A3B3XH97_9TELE
EKVVLRCEIPGGEGSQWMYEWRTARLNEGQTSNENITIGLIKPTVTLRPSWPLIYKGEKVVLRCEIPGGEGSQWMYEWRTARLNEGQTSNENITIASVTESHSGEYSCRGTSGDGSTSWSDVVVLTVPVHPVTEGDPVTLSCRDKKQQLLSKVFFYHNDKLLHNDSRGELNISAVSKSDEGFYKCQHSGKDSPRSWMSVRGEEDFKDFRCLLCCWSRSLYSHYSPALVVVLQTVQR